MIGSTLAHYEITALLGKGGMGEVYRARDTQLERDVALKILPSETSQDPERIARFRREARTLATLQHTNVASIYGFEDTAEARFLVMELVEGEGLDERLARGPIPPSDALEIASQIACGLEAAHEQGVVHRDLKPANVKVTRGGEVKILDFGLARAYLGDTEDDVDPTTSPTITAAMTQAGVVLGTAAYMSPEQARGKPVDKRADIWAFGVILYEMLTGKRLFAGDTVSDTLASVLRTDVDLAELPQDCPTHVVRLLERCLDRDASTRLRDIGEARVRLGRSDPTSAPGPSSTPSRSRVALAAVLGLIVGGALVAVPFLGRESTAPPSPIRFSIPRASTDTPRSDISPDGSRILFVSEARLWVRSFAEPDRREVLGSEGAVCATWSADGEWIAYSTITDIYRSRPDGSNRSRVCEVPNDLHPWAGSLAWTDEDRILFAPGDSGLWSVAASGGDPTVLLAPDEGEVDFHHVSVLPGNRGYLFHPHIDRRFDSIHLFDGDSRRELLRVEGQQLNSAVYVDGHILFWRSPDNAGVWALPFSLDRLETTGAPFLVEPDATFPVASVAGHIAYAPDTPMIFQIIRLDERGNVTAEIGEPVEGASDLRISPDGSEALMVVDEKDTAIWRVDLESGQRQRITFGGGSASSPSWSSDGQRIVHTVGESNRELHQEIRERNGTAVKIVSVRGYSPVLTPDGRYLVLTVWNDANEPSIGYVDLAQPESGPVMVAETNFAEESPAVSPSGRLLAYESVESGRREIYVQTFPESGGRWQISQQGGFGPAWDSAGDQLYFSDASSGWLMVVDVSADPLRFSAPRRAFSKSNLVDVSPTPEGGFIALRRSLAGRQGSYDVWLNWSSRPER